MNNTENKILEKLLKKIRETRQIDETINHEFKVLKSNINNCFNEISLKIKEEKAKI
jgi:hypothetical protein